MVEGVGLREKKLGQTRPTSMTHRTSRVGGERAECFRLPPDYSLSFLLLSERRGRRRRQKAKVRYAGNRAAGNNVLDFFLDAPVQCVCVCVYTHTRGR